MNRCPDCDGSTRVVTAVTVGTLGEPVQVLVTRQCVTPTCQLKFPVMKPEERLTGDERAAWRGRQTGG